MRHGLQWIMHLQAHGLRKGDEHPAYTSLTGQLSLALLRGRLIEYQIRLG